MAFHTARAAIVGAILASAGVASAVEFQITIENLGPQPLSPAIFIAGNDSHDIFTAGTAASGSLEKLAEDGDPTLLANDAEAARLAGNVLDWEIAHPGSPIPPGTTATVTINADETFHWLSFASMLGATNDGFIGSAIGPNDGQIDLFNNGEPLSANFTISFLDVWDAGTEVNTEASEDLIFFGNFGGPSEGGVLTQPHLGIRGDNDLPSSLNWYGHDVARITVQAVPEPATMLALAPGLLLLRRRRRVMPQEPKA